MRNGFVLILFSLLLVSLDENDPGLRFNLKVNSEEENISLSDVQVVITANEFTWFEGSTDLNGKISQTILPFENTYFVLIKKEGYVSKLLEINLSTKNVEEIDPYPHFSIEMSLFKKLPEVDLSYLEKMPIAKFNLSTTGRMAIDTEYTNKMGLEVKEKRGLSVAK